MEHFAKIDLKAAYNQIEIDEKFKEVTMMNTPTVLLKWMHLPFGVKMSNHIFQKVIKRVL